MIAPPHQSKAKSITVQILMYVMIAIGAFLAAFALEVFLMPNKLIDGGITGIGMIAAQLLGNHLLPLFVVALNLPFLYLGYRNIGTHFVVHMIFAIIVLALSMFFIQNLMPWAIFTGDKLEVVVIGGSILGIGVGMTIRYGGCLDGTEILGIIINKRFGFTVGQVVLFCNIFIFAAAGIAYNDWHTPILSLIMYMVAIKVMDAVIVGLDETKSVLIISQKSKQISEAIIHELKLGLTIMYGRGGYSGDEREILYVICERLQLAELKELIHRVDPTAFIAIENLHEVANASLPSSNGDSQKRIEKLMTSILKPNK